MSTFHDCLARAAIRFTTTAHRLARAAIRFTTTAHRLAAAAFMLLLGVQLALPLPGLAQDRENAWEGAAFVSAGKVGLNYSDISMDVREFVGPAYSFGEDVSVMVGFNLNFTSTAERPATVSLFAGCSVRQFIGLGYSFDLINQQAEKLIGWEKDRYKVQHSLLFGALVRHPDL